MDKDRKFIELLAGLLAERRSDISEICDNYLKYEKYPTIKDIERRYINAEIEELGTYVQYDTLTTEISYNTLENVWKTCKNHEYTND